MRYLSVCSGIEACSVAWESLGWIPAGFSEIEPFPRAVLEQRFGAQAVDWDHRHTPQSNLLPLFGDFTKIEAHHVGPIDLLVGGTPCQAFSVAGKRLGLDDPRGHLTLEFLALARRLRPRWLLWENVPGVLSDDKGRTLGTFLGIVGQLGYRGCYRVLDAQFVRVAGFGRAVPQRRRRVFFVGHLGDDARAFPVLFEPESLSGHPTPRREAGQSVAQDVAPSLVSSGRGVERCGETRGQDPVVAVHCQPVAPTLNAAFGDKLGLEDQHINGGGGACSLPPVSMCLNAGSMGRQDAESETLIPITGGVFDVAHTLRGAGFDASEDGTRRGTPIVPVAPTMQAGGNGTGGDRPYGTTVDTCDSLVPIALPTQLSPALSVKHTMAVAFSCKDHGAGTGEIASREVAGALTSNYGKQPDSSDSALGPTLAIQAGALRENPASGPDGVGVQEGISYTLEARSEVQAVAHGWAVRRLTPTECEKLQGFPPGWTAVTYRGKPAADGPRYKAIGNSMAINVVRWIGQRIQWADDVANHSVANK